MMHLERRPGDTLLLLGGSLNERLEWNAGLAAALDAGPLTIVPPTGKTGGQDHAPIVEAFTPPPPVSR
jgi:hypothetical protein